MTHYKDTLMKAYAPQEEGIWIIWSCDSNYDLGGSHARTKLDTVEGEYSDVVAYALELPRFLDSWGDNGYIEKVVPSKKITKHSVEKRTSLLKEREELQERLTEIESQL